jgi:hypothetical protein
MHGIPSCSYVPKLLSGIEADEVRPEVGIQRFPTCARTAAGETGFIQHVAVYDGDEI